jgi:DNA-directed RNA polymerase specialized sigma24 family protein
VLDMALATVKKHLHDGRQELALRLRVEEGNT